MQSIGLKLLFPFAIALAAFCAIANGSAWQQSKPSSADAGELLLNVSVRDKSGLPVTGLSRQSFSVLIDKLQAELLRSYRQTAGRASPFL
jgi:hypothetical protein